MESSTEHGPGEGPAQKVWVSMPASRVAAVKARVGARGFSAYISAAVERQIQRDLLEELLSASEEETGPIPQSMTDRATDAFRAAQALAEAEDTGEGNQGGTDVARPQGQLNQEILLLDSEGLSKAVSAGPQVTAFIKMAQSATCWSR